MLSTKVQKYMVLDKKNVISLRKNIYLCKLLTNNITMKKLSLLLLSLLFTFAAYADDDRACQAPTNVKVTIQENDPGYSFVYKAIISWDAVEGAEGYQVNVKGGTAIEFQELGLTNSLFYVAGSNNTGTLEFQVKTICSTGEYSEASETVEAFIGPQNNCPAPTGLYATVEEGTEYENRSNGRIIQTWLQRRCRKGSISRSCRYSGFRYRRRARSRKDDRGKDPRNTRHRKVKRHRFLCSLRRLRLQLQGC